MIQVFKDFHCYEKSTFKDRLRVTSASKPGSRPTICFEVSHKEEPRGIELNLLYIKLIKSWDRLPIS